MARNRHLGSSHGVLGSVLTGLHHKLQTLPEGQRVPGVPDEEAEAQRREITCSGAGGPAGI